MSATTRIEALRPTNFSVYGTDFVSMMGPSGSGKSTLLNLLGLLIRPTTGTVCVDGRDTKLLADAQLSHLRGAAVGFVFQDYHLLPDASASENVALPLIYAGVRPLRRRVLAANALEQVDLFNRRAAQPRELSGGERQRVAIARAIARRPRILLCDEPTGNLDSASARRVMQVLSDLNGDGLAVIIATHNPEVAELATRRLAVRDGELAEA